MNYFDSDRGDLKTDSQGKFTTGSDRELLYLVRSTLIGDDPDSLLPHLDEHLTFLQGLYADSKLTFGGPFYTTEGKKPGDGMYALKVGSLEEALRLAHEGDPFHRLNIRDNEVILWSKDDW
jgi:uncharacterized protein YciI